MSSFGAFRFHSDRVNNPRVQFRKYDPPHTWFMVLSDCYIGELATLLESDKSNHFNEPQQTAHVETAVSTKCKSCLLIAYAPEK